MSILTRFVPLAGALLLVIALGAACGGGGDSDDSNGDDSVSGDPITITTTDNAFGPNAITIPVDTTVEITVKNEGLAPHTMRVLSKDAEGKDFTSDLFVNPTESSTFEVKFTTKGEFAFQCDYHLPDMVGTITVK